MRYLLDTNILIHLIRRSEKALQIERDFQLFSPENILFISAVTKGELLSFAKQSEWGLPKMQRLREVLQTVSGIPITSESPLMDAYADIDAFSQGKHPEYDLPPGLSARNMGKNDLWIASTAFLLDIPLLTTDADFEHLHPNFIVVHRV